MPRKRGKGRAVRRARQKFGTYYESEDVKKAPHSMVIHRGHVDKDVRELVQDVRKVMEPFTASELSVSKKNSLKDFVAIAGPLHVTHLIMFTQTERGDYMKIARLPRGPTIHFKLVEYSLRRDVLSVIKRKHTHQKQFLMQPLLILNGFSGAATTTPTTPKPDTDNSNENNPTPTQQSSSNSGGGEFQNKLLATTLQNMFPSLNVTKIELEEMRRCVLFTYNKEDGTIDFRQYYIRLLPLGLSKPVKKLVQENLPDLSNFKDISEFIEKGGNLSESEAEFDGPENEVELTKDEKNAKTSSSESKTQRNAVRLSEIGPRLKLRLVKIQEGVCDGEILYHSLVRKTPEEIEALRQKTKQMKKEKAKLKAKRDAQQSENKNGKRGNLKRKREDVDGDDDDEGDEANDDDNNDYDDDDDDDNAENGDSEGDGGVASDEEGKVAKKLKNNNNNNKKMEFRRKGQLPKSRAKFFRFSKKKSSQMKTKS